MMKIIPSARLSRIGCHMLCVGTSCKCLPCLVRECYFSDATLQLPSKSASERRSSLAIGPCLLASLASLPLHSMVDMKRA
ncbi:hypothetical protein DL95DRAFT_399004 [Leptodontidium sp. 2 PMI_412]|nr:hypothetical protein DL95DRAFT_399004 [Leptodontidium sp. 2 PMI_412]